MNTLLIGATGQIGYALAQNLSSSTKKLTVLVREKAKLGFASAVTLRSAAQFDEHVFEQALVGQDRVIYGIGLPEPFAPSKDMFDRINYDLSALFLKALTRSSVKRLAYIPAYEVFSVLAGVIYPSPQLPKPMVHASITAMEAGARLLGMRPLLSVSQLDF
jgi:uncharacterized protein YbjT (DUF2867 family)